MECLRIIIPTLPGGDADVAAVYDGLMWSFAAREMLVPAASHDPLERLLRVNLAYRAGEHIAIITDHEPFAAPTSRLPNRLALARRLAEAARNISGEAVVLTYDALGPPGTEPPREVFEAVYPAGFVARLAASGLLEPLLAKTIDTEGLARARTFATEAPSRIAVVLALSGRSITHTRFCSLLVRTGHTRIATMPGIEPHMFVGVLAADWPAVARRSREVAGRLTRATGAEIRTTSDMGEHILRFSLAGRGAFADTGFIRRPGSVGNLPGGEATIAPVEGTATGEGLLGEGEEACLVRFEGGRLAHVIGTGAIASELARVLRELPAAAVLAELGIGTNDKARDASHPLEAEKILGTAHIALGDNSGFGGALSVPYHRDFVMHRPTLIVSYDGGTRETLIDSGRSILMDPDYDSSLNQ